MIRINKVWSEENKFKELPFKSGMNFIVGDSSKDEHGNVSSEQRNGSGKSYSIELINFALLKRSSESRIYEVPDSILPPNSYVYINLTIGEEDVTIARNKSGSVLMKLGTADFSELDEKTAKNELANLCKLDGELSFRDLCNFLIKESHYTYSTFLYFFVSNTIARLNASLYFFGFPVKTFESMRIKQDEFDAQNTVMRVTNKKIEEKGLSIEKLRSLQSELEQKIKMIEDGLSYEKISTQVSNSSEELQKDENTLTSLLRQKGKVSFQLSEIEEFVDYSDEDEIITDKQLGKFFNKHVKGLGDFVQNDLEQLKKFRDELAVFESEMLFVQKEALDNQLDGLRGDIKNSEERIKKHKLLIDDGKNYLQKGLRMSTDLINDFNENKKILEDHDEFKQNVRKTTAEFQTLYSELESSFLPLFETEESFRRTFLEIHEKVYGDKSGEFGFDLSTKRNIRDKEFFKIKVKADRQGSEGVNRVRQVLYDLSLMTNEFTTERSQKLLIHDRLLFGDIDNDATFNILNYINSLDQDTFQYIATYNSDAMSPEVANQSLDFDIEDKIAIKLSVKDPIFYKPFKQQLDYEEKTK